MCRYGAEIKASREIIVPSSRVDSASIMPVDGTDAAASSASGA